MKSLRPFDRRETAVGYSSALAHQLFESVTRDTGLPYTQEHLNEVALLVGRVTIPSQYQNAAIAAAWLHDSAEDIEDIDVCNPFEETTRQPDTTYLNNLLTEAGDEGIAVRFMVNLMTHRGGILYQDYVQNIFNFPEVQPQRSLHILTGLIKMSDRRKNTGPDEEKNVNRIEREYLALEGADERTLIEFYKRTKTIDAFRKKGRYNLDTGLFVETLRESFRKKQRSIAIDNLTQYLPLAEDRLLIKVGENNGLFDWREVREMLKETYIESLRLYPGDIYDLRRSGLHRSANRPPSYTPILKEIRTESLGKK